MKKFLGVLLCVTMLLTVFTACTKIEDETNSPSDQASTQAADNNGGNGGNNDISDKKYFIVGFDADFPPMGFLDENGEYVGFDLDLAKEAASRMGLEFKAQPIAWDSKDSELSSGNIDCIWNGFTISGRENDYAWTDAYMENKQVVVVNSDSDIATLADLSGRIVAVQKDSSGLAAVNDNEELKNSIGSLLEEDNYLTAMMELESGAVDAIVMDEIVARYQIQKSGKDFKILNETVASETYGVGFDLGNTELRDQVQSVLEEMAADGTLAEISNNWFGKDVTIIGK